MLCMGCAQNKWPTLRGPFVLLRDMSSHDAALALIG